MEGEGEDKPGSPKLEPNVEEKNQPPPDEQAGKGDENPVDKDEPNKADLPSEEPKSGEGEGESVGKVDVDELKKEEVEKQTTESTEKAGEASSEQAQSGGENRHQGQMVTIKTEPKAEQSETSDVKAEAKDGEQSIAPTEEEQSTAPTEEGQSTAPVEEGQSTAPAEEGQSTAPVEEEQSTAPTEEGQSTGPTEERESTEQNSGQAAELTEASEAVEGEGAKQESEKAEEQQETVGDVKSDAEGKESIEQTEGEEAEKSEVLKDGEEEVEDENQNAADKEEEVKEKEADKTDEEKPEEEKKEEDDNKIPVDFFYKIEDMVSHAKVSEESGLPEDLLVLQHSFGYDCTKRANLHILDVKTVVFAAGNMVQLLDLQTKEQTYIRSTSGGGIGAIAVHPSRKYFAVAEKGEGPNINIFEYPSLKLYRILRGGTERSYNYVDLDGDLLGSQGGDPDYMLTLWNWKEEKTVLRCKAFSQEVFRVSFSTELEGQLTTAGTGHIRFWKMADTFTGLKLQGAIGKFGKTEITDIEGYVELPDGKVLSGSEWGNMLLWEGGLIKVEITRKGRKTCHHGVIEQILLDEGELMTIGMDGFIRVWDFEQVDTADTIDDSGLFEMEPMNELKVGQDVSLRSIVKSVDSENEPTIWYAQDANGGIWKLDLSFSHTSHAPEKLFTYHAGPILGLDSSPVTEIVATTGLDRTLRIFDFAQKTQLSETRFTTGGCCLVWVPRTVDPKGSTIIAGFEDGVVRVITVTKIPDRASGRRGKQDCEVTLEQAFKPHSKKVASLDIDSKGEILASGSEDCTVFFMSIGKEYKPIGFIETPKQVLKLQWTPAKFKKSSLLVFCEDGEEHEDELERNGLQEIGKEEKKKEEEKGKRVERGQRRTEQGEDGRANGHPYTDSNQFASVSIVLIFRSFFFDKIKLIFEFQGGFDAGYLYECKFLSDDEKAIMDEELVDQPIRSVAVLESDDIPISMMKYSPNGRQILLGMQNGSIRIQSLETEFDLSTLGPYWRLNTHDNTYGHVTGMIVSQDNSILLSVGADGNFFHFNIMDQEKIDKKVAAAKAKLPSAKKAGEEKIVDDIDDPNAYSIEDAKQKAEYDKMMKEAEEKKRQVRRHITQLRRQFKSILEKNDGLPRHLQLKKDEFELDREIKQELEKQKQDRIEMVRKELAWESEKQRIALEKLRWRFKDVVECERIVVKAFATTHEVGSFRASKLSDDFYQLRAMLEQRRATMITQSDATRDQTRDLLTGQTRGTETGGVATGKQEEKAGLKTITSLKGNKGERINKALKKVEEKKKKRAARRAQWNELYNTKPDDDYEDPADIKKIKEAQENMGDYKLKTAKDYVVPDHLRMNVEKARGRLLILKDAIHEYKYNFNVQLLALRDKKVSTIEQIRELVAELKEVRSRLTPDKRKKTPPIPELHPEEMPEKKLEYTRETLIQFKSQMEERERNAKKVASDSGGGFGGFGGFGGAPEGKATSPTPGAKPSGSRLDDAGSRPSTGKSQQDTEEDKEELSPLEQQIKVAEEICNIYHQDRLLAQIEELVRNFDAELRILRHDKFKFSVVMKNADLRQVTLFEELVLLKEFEKREDSLAEKVSNKQNEKLDMQNKLLDVQTKLEGKKKEIEKLLEREKNLNSTFVQSLGENNKFADYLTKVFKKKIKRAKKKQQKKDQMMKVMMIQMMNLTGMMRMKMRSLKSVAMISTCVPQDSLYDKTCELREKRLDIEEALAEEKKNSEALRKENEGFQKKSKIIDVGLKTAQNDLEAFQLEKQQKLNELDVVVTLKLHQIQYMINGILPQDLSQTLVFQSNGAIRLQQRIKELEHEKSSQKKHMKESRKKHVQLIKDRKVFEEKVETMEKACNELMIGKFGRIVDLEKLETVTVNRNIEELKEKLRVTEIQCAEEAEEFDEKIGEEKSAITALIRDNTRLLDQLRLLLEDKKQFETSLNSRQKKMGEEFSGTRKADINERQRLIQLVQLQAQEIDALKEEIMLLSRKGGHILPPAQPPLPQSPPNMRTISN
ncbi:hypothetical protein ScPMuIL_002998 [Solemya velum]